MSVLVQGRPATITPRSSQASTHSNGAGGTALEFPKIDFTGHTPLYLLAHMEHTVLPQLHIYLAAFAAGPRVSSAWISTPAIEKSVRTRRLELIKNLERPLREIFCTECIDLARRLDRLGNAPPVRSLSKQQSREVSRAKSSLVLESSIFVSKANFESELSYLRAYPQLIREVLSQISKLFAASPESMSELHVGYFARVNTAFAQIILESYGKDLKGSPSTESAVAGGEIGEQVDDFASIEREIFAAEVATAAEAAESAAHDGLLKPLPGTDPTHMMLPPLPLPCTEDVMALSPAPASAPLKAARKRATPVKTIVVGKREPSQHNVVETAAPGGDRSISSLLNVVRPIWRAAMENPGTTYASSPADLERMDAAKEKIIGAGYTDSKTISAATILAAYLEHCVGCRIPARDSAKIVASLDRLGM